MEPESRIIAGELANDPQDVGNNQGLFHVLKTRQMWKDFLSVVEEPGCWWLWCNPDLYRGIPEARWDLDDVSSITAAYFDLVLQLGG